MVITSDEMNLGGMSMRDWFAGMALAGLCANPNRDMVRSEFASASYKQADAMIAERERKE